MPFKKLGIINLKGTQNFPNVCFSEDFVDVLSGWSLISWNYDTDRNNSLLWARLSLQVAYCWKSKNILKVS